MKLIVNASPVRPTVLTVANGDDIVATTEVYGGSVISAIDRIFKERYIESVEFKQFNNYTQKFIDHIENNHKGIVVTFNKENLND